MTVTTTPAPTDEAGDQARKVLAYTPKADDLAARLDRIEQQLAGLSAGVLLVVGFVSRCTALLDQARAWWERWRPRGVTARARARCSRGRPATPPGVPAGHRPRPLR